MRGDSLELPIHQATAFSISLLWASAKPIQVTLVEPVGYLLFWGKLTKSLSPGCTTSCQRGAFFRISLDAGISRAFCPVY